MSDKFIDSPEYKEIRKLITRDLTPKELIENEFVKSLLEKLKVLKKDSNKTYQLQMPTTFYIQVIDDALEEWKGE